MGVSGVRCWCSMRRWGGEGGHLCRSEELKPWCSLWVGCSLFSCWWSRLCPATAAAVCEQVVKKAEAAMLAKNLDKEYLVGW